MAQSVKWKKCRLWLWSLGIAFAVSFLQLILHPRTVEAGLLPVLETPAVSLDLLPVSLELPVVEVSAPVQPAGMLPVLPSLLPAVELNIPAVSVQTPILEIDLQGIPVTLTPAPTAPLPLPLPETEREPSVEVPVPIPVSKPESPQPEALKPVPAAEPERRIPDVKEEPEALPPEMAEPPKPEAAGKPSAPERIRKPLHVKSVPDASEPAREAAKEKYAQPGPGTRNADPALPFPKKGPQKPAGSLAWMPGSGPQVSGGTSIGPAGSAPYQTALGLLSPEETGKLPSMSIMRYERFRLFGASQWCKPPPRQPPKHSFSFDIHSTEKECFTSEEQPSLAQSFHGIGHPDGGIVLPSDLCVRIPHGEQPFHRDVGLR